MPPENSPGFFFYTIIESIVLLFFVGSDVTEIALEWALTNLKQSFRWNTSMVGRKAYLKSLTSKLREVGVTIVTEFVKGQTCHWGLSWSFVPPFTKIVKSRVIKNDLFFILERSAYQAAPVWSFRRGTRVRAAFACNTVVVTKASFYLEIVPKSDPCRSRKRVFPSDKTHGKLLGFRAVLIYDDLSKQAVRALDGKEREWNN
ncbi:hypothetical protein POM88_053596 [Heracleum sosnowskyi]|uniref:Uncharacterized protein n=1 Tax=Heracleum sosnowskyi TaxID=360622 RepID=A0AAD8GQ12_9APIA|nr:hypothetical protein POM88_053596 [Heracleum sosnowskyi]